MTFASCLTMGAGAGAAHHVGINNIAESDEWSLVSYPATESAPDVQDQDIHDVLAQGLPKFRRGVHPGSDGVHAYSRWACNHNLTLFAPRWCQATQPGQAGQPGQPASQPRLACDHKQPIQISHGLNTPHRITCALSAICRRQIVSTTILS